MSASLTFQPRKPTSDFNQDLNGDGIPDGAQISMAKEIMDDAGNKSRITAKWNKGDSRPPAGVMGEPPATNAAGSSDVFAAPPPGKAPAPKAPTAAEIFKERTDRNGDRMGMGRSNTTERPVLFDDRVTALNKKAGTMSNSVAERQSAVRELDQLLGIHDREAGRDLARHQSDNERDAAIALNQGKQTIEQIKGGAKVQAATVIGQSREAAAGTTAEQRQKQADDNLQLERDKMAQRDRLEQMRLDAWQSRAADKATLSAAKDQQSRQKAAKSYLDREFGDSFSKQSLRGYIQETRDTKTGEILPSAKVDPVFESRLDDLNAEWTKATGKAYIQSPGTNPASSGQTHGPAISRKKSPNGKMMMRDANGNVWEE